MSTNSEASDSGGCGCLTFFGAPIAAICSWTINHSILWAAFHAIFWPLYLVYLCMGCGGGLPDVMPW